MLQVSYLPASPHRFEALEWTIDVVIPEMRDQMPRPTFMSLTTRHKSGGRLSLYGSIITLSASTRIFRTELRTLVLDVTGKTAEAE